MAALVNAFEFPVAIDRSLGQLKQQRDYATYVGQLVKQVLLTTPGERAHRPDFGAGLLGMVFAPNDDATASLMQTTILEALNTWLGSIISVSDVLVQANGNILNVTVTYKVLARGNQEVLNLEVTI
jgi:Bacteriophage baseplate protein W